MIKNLNTFFPSVRKNRQTDKEKQTQVLILLCSTTTKLPVDIQDYSLGETWVGSDGSNIGTTINSWTGSLTVNGSENGGPIPGWLVSSLLSFSKCLLKKVFIPPEIMKLYMSWSCWVEILTFTYVCSDIEHLICVYITYWIKLQNNMHQVH